jgi:hypothetical protein
VSTRRNAGNSQDHSATIAMVPAPPSTTAGTLPNHCAVMPDSNCPTSFDAPMKHNAHRANTDAWNFGAYIDSRIIYRRVDSILTAENEPDYRPAAKAMFTKTLEQGLRPLNYFVRSIRQPSAQTDHLSGFSGKSIPDRRKARCRSAPTARRSRADSRL